MRLHPLNRLSTRFDLGTNVYLENSSTCSGGRLDGKLCETTSGELGVKNVEFGMFAISVRIWLLWPSKAGASNAMKNSSLASVTVGNIPKGGI